MRRLRWALLGFVVLAMGNSANAQSFANGLTGIKPSDVQFKQIDIPKTLMAPQATTQNIGPSRFSLSNLLRPFVGPSTKPVRGSSIIPNQQYPNAYNPLPPINSTVPGR